MKKVKSMKHNVLFVAMLVSGLALAQAPAQKPAPAPEAPKPAAEAPKPMAEAPKPTAEVAKPAPARKSRRNEDARKCLDEADNNAIIKCAEAYL